MFLAVYFVHYFSFAESLARLFCRLLFLLPEEEEACSLAASFDLNLKRLSDGSFSFPGVFPSTVAHLMTSVWKPVGVLDRSFVRWDETVVVFALPATVHSVLK